MNTNVWIQIASTGRTPQGQDVITGFVFGTTAPAPRNIQHGSIDSRGVITIQTGRFAGAKLETRS